jgi:type I restriction enzyme M protein
MDYWAETMRDDVYLIVDAGWVEAAKPRLVVETKEQKSREPGDFSVGKQNFKSDLVPAALLIAKYFSKEQTAIDAAESALSMVEPPMEEINRG